MAAVSTIKVVADSSQAQRELTKLTTQLGNLQNKIAAIGFGTIIANTIAFADNLQDLSDATGIATSSLLGFQTAVQQSGGSADSADKAVLRFLNTIGDAAEGGLAAQNAFARVGVNLKDLGTLSEQDLLKKTIDGLGKITDKSEQARLKTAMFGKEFRSVAVEDLAARYAKATAESVKYADSIKSAADAQAKLETAVKQFKLSLLEALKPLTDFVGNLDDKQVKEFTDAVVKIGTAAAAIYVLYQAFMALAKVVTVVAGALAFLAKNLNPMVRIATIVASALALVAQGIEKITGLDIFDKLAKALGLVNDESERRGRGHPEEIKNREAAAAASQKEAEKLREVTDALAKRRQEIQKASAAFADQNANIIDNINFEKALIGKTEDVIAVEKAREEIFKRAASESEKLRQAKAALGKDESALAAVYDQQIKKIQEQSEVDADRVARATTGLQGMRMIEQARLKDIENTTKAIEDQIARQQQLGDILRSALDQQKTAEFEGAQAGRSPFERQMESIKENARKAALEAGRAFADTFEDSGDGLSVEKAAELAAGLEQIAQRYQEIAATQLSNLEYSRSFAAGWKEAFDEYVDNATNAANIARNAFQSLTSNMESALDEFVKTGKLNFGDFARSVIQDLLKIQLKAAAINMLKAVGGGNFLGSLFGFAKGGYVGTNKPVLVGENGPEVISGAAGMTVTPNWKMNGQAQPVTNNYYNISAVDAKGVAQLFAENRMTLLGTVRQAEKELPFRGR
jgi:lambda family phage tail tape measure protein